MSLLNPRDPHPKLQASKYVPISWPIRESLILEPGAVPLIADLATLFSGRRSHAEGGLPKLNVIAAMLWHVSRTLATLPSPYGFPMEHRPVPSAGALHPIHILLQIPGGAEWARYNPQCHCLDIICGYDKLLEGLQEQARVVAENKPGVYMAFVGEPGRLSAKYENHESLLWRDAGVLQGSVCLAAEAHGLGVCLLGVTGHEWLSQLAEQGKLVGVGLARLYARA